MIFAARKNVDDDNLPIVFAAKMGNYSVGRQRKGKRTTAESMSSLVEPHRVVGLEKDHICDSRKPVSQLAYPVTAPIPAMCKVAAYLL